jgi:hypothetical protein
MREPAPLPGAGDLTPAHLSALAALLQLLPTGDLIALLSGGATVDTVIGIAEQAASIVKWAIPPAALPAEAARMALQALQFLLDAVGVGANPVTGGIPNAFPPGGGPGPYRGR